MLVTTTVQDRKWDLTPVIDLIHSLSITEHDPDTKSIAYNSKEFAHINELTDDYAARKRGLGNFDRVWQSLGRPLDTPPLAVPPGLAKSKIPNNKTVQWSDEVGGDKKLEAQDELSRAVTKTQKKRKRRKLRKVAQSAFSEPDEVVATSSSDEDLPDIKEQVSKRSHGREAIIQRILQGTQKPSTPKRALSDTDIKARTTSSQERLKKNGIPFTPTREASVPLLTPASVSSGKRDLRPVSGDTDIDLQSASVKKLYILDNLPKRFPEDQVFLDAQRRGHPFPPNLTSATNNIHVFVDISNILIGFYNILKMNRGLPIWQKITRPVISFHNLSLVLERGRPAVKRVLAGSDNFESVQEAKLLGYEISLLDRVHKAKELTPRQRGFLAAEYGTSGQSSGSETVLNIAAVPTHAPARNVEQAVDEILHLKILESIVDSDEPATMVVVTGDAAEAEYSGGFKVMIEKALKKNWKVELVSFKRNISQQYRKAAFREEWGDKFRIIELDEWAECFLAA